VPEHTTTTLTPTFIVYLNETRFSAEQEADVKEVVIVESIDAPSLFSIKMSDMSRKWTDHADFSEGSEVKIQLGFKDEVAELMNGEIVGIYPAYRKNADDFVVIRGNSHLHRLDNGKRTRSFTNMAESDVIGQIASEANMQSDVDAVGSEKPFILQKDLSDYDYIMLLAKRFNCRVWSKDETLYFKQIEANSGSDLVVEWGKTLLSFDPKLNSRGLLTEVEVRGWDDQNCSSVVGSATLNTIALKVGGETLGGSNVQSSIGDVKTIFTDDDIKDKDTADQVALGLLTDNSLNYIVATGSCEGNNKVRAGSIIEIKEVGTRFSGHYLVNSVRHFFSASQGYHTSFQLCRNATS
jgi:uncharacterized protein